MERTYVFNQDGNNGNGGGSKFDIMAMLPNLMGSKGVDPGLLALLNQGRGSQDQWGGSWWFIWIILLWFCWGGNGFGNRFGNGGGLPAELNGDVGREYLMSAIQGNGNAINQLASSLNCSTQQLQSALCNIQGLIANVGNQVGMSSQQIINAFQSGNQAVLTQIADCCCKTQNAITTMGYENQLAMCNQTNALVNTANQNALSMKSVNIHIALRNGNNFSKFIFRQYLAHIKLSFISIIHTRPINNLFVRMASVYIESCDPFSPKSSWTFDYSSRHSLPTIQYSLG